MKTSHEHQALSLRLAGPDRRALFQAVYEAQVRRAGLPTRIEIDHRQAIFDPKAHQDYLKGLENSAWFPWLQWFDAKGALLIHTADTRLTVVTTYRESWLDPRRVLQFLTEIPFTAGSLTPYDPGVYQNMNYRPLSLAEAEAPLGTAFLGLALRGPGHDRLVSRRVLDAGPFRVLRDEATDTTLIQFCDWHADAPTMITQAAPGHRFIVDRQDEASRLWLHRPHPYTTAMQGAYYTADDRAVNRPVTGRKVSAAEMLDAVAAMRMQGWGAPGPVEHVRFRFMYEHEARAHLHASWLRGLECWFGLDRIDDRYHPVFERPAWVHELETREAAGSGANGT